MNAVEICTTLLLPMCVSPRRPTFSLQYHSAGEPGEKKKFHVFTRYTALHRSVLHASLHRCSSTNNRTKNSFNQHANTLHIIKHNQYSSRWSPNTKNSLHMWKYREINKQKKMEQRAQWQDLQANTSAEDMCWRSCSTCKPWCCDKCSSWLHEMFKKANS